MEEIPGFEKSDEGIKYIKEKEFYPYPDGTLGGGTKHIYVFKARKKGNFKIKYQNFRKYLKVFL